MFAFEEAIGFMCGTTVLDKDGINAALHLAILASYLHHHGLSLIQQLEEIYRVYGYHTCCNSYFICHDPDKIKRIFERLRNYKGTNTVRLYNFISITFLVFNCPLQYPTEIIDGKYKIKSVRDLTVGYDNSQPDNKPVLPVSKSSQMITFSFRNGLTATLRTSGTEPKIKYYTELSTPPEQEM